MGLLSLKLARAYSCQPASRSDILEEESMSGYSEESADRVRRVGGIAFLAWAWLGPHVSPAQAEERTDQLEAVIVTGSFVPRTDTETPSPLTVISAEDIAQSGLTSTADIVRTLTADNSGTLPTSFVGAAAGAAGVSLRGMTVNSTLVLIDGHRATNYPLADDGQRTFVDLNTIPLDVVDHIEVLKDGASSVYGADAIAGVVNIILKKTFTGLQTSAEVGTSSHGDGTMRRGTLTVGSGDLGSGDRFNAYFNLEYEKDGAIRVGERGFPFNTNDLTPIGGNNLNPQPSVFPYGTIYGSATPAPSQAHCQSDNLI
jgi:iron complex outermembrane receptor protein